MSPVVNKLKRPLVTYEDAANPKPGEPSVAA
jgi:hypothetical protein